MSRSKMVVKGGRTSRKNTPVVLGQTFARIDGHNFFGFRKTKNPLFVWQEYQQCRLNRKPIPSWVGRYLDECATNVLKMVDDPPKEGGINAATARAFQFARSGRSNPFGESYRTFHQNLMLSMMVRHLNQERGIPVTKAYAEVARDRHVSRATVERAYAWMVANDEADDTP